MSNRIGLALAATLLIPSSLAMVVASPAHAEDQQPCVSKAEFIGMHDGSLSRAEVEARWEVTGRGIDYWDGWFGHLIIYPKCGAEKAAAQGIYWYGVKYNNRETGWQYLVWDH